MTTAHVDPTETNRIAIGRSFEDQRTGEVRAVVYADEMVVLTRDEAGHTTLTPRETFESLLGTRYRVRPDADPDVEMGPPVAAASGDGSGETPEAGENERLDAFADERAEAGDEADDASESDADGDGEVDFEAVDGIGPATAGQLRSTGYVTERDVRRASDDDLLGVAGVGPSALAAIRKFVG